MLKSIYLPKTFNKMRQFLLILIIASLFIVACEKDDKDDNIEPQPTDTLATDTVTTDTVKAVYTEKYIDYTIGETDIEILVGEKDYEGVIYYNMHENEVTAAEAGLETVKDYGGRIIILHSKGKREVTFRLDGEYYSFDPNRIYTPVGAKATLKNYGNYSADALEETNKFARFITDSILKETKLIITLHNNSSSGYSAKSYLPGEMYASDSATVYIEDGTDPDDFYYVTDKRFYDFLIQRGYNVVLQNNEMVVDDGSLSVFCGFNGILYINVEAQMGHYTEQIDMLDELQILLKEVLEL